jgi:hypothetical protein
VRQAILTKAPNQKQIPFILCSKRWKYLCGRTTNIAGTSKNCVVESKLLQHFVVGKLLVGKDWHERAKQRARLSLEDGETETTKVDIDPLDESPV